jgi:hypothetical protein
MMKGMQTATLSEWGKELVELAQIFDGIDWLQHSTKYPKTITLRKSTQVFGHNTLTNYPPKGNTTIYHSGYCDLMILLGE